MWCTFLHLLSHREKTILLWSVYFVRQTGGWTERPALVTLIHSHCTSLAEDCQIIIYIKSSKIEKPTKKINTLLNNLLLPNSLCGPAGWRDYLHLFPFKTFFLLPLFCSPSSLNEVDIRVWWHFYSFFLSSSLPGSLHTYVCLLSWGHCNPNRRQMSGVLRSPGSVWPKAERKGITKCCQVIF